MPREIIHSTFEEIISEATNHDEWKYLTCQDCGDYIGYDEEYYDINGEILCRYCMASKYQRTNRGNMF